MKTFVFVLTLLTALSAISCSKRGREEIAPPTNTPAGPSMEISWAPADLTQPRPTLSRALESADGSNFQSAQPVTLPAKTPTEIELTMRLAGFAAPTDQLFAQGSFTQDAQSVQALPDVIRTRINEAGQLEVTVRVGGMTALFPQDSSQRSSLTLDLFDQSARLFTLKADVRTPPSALKTTRVSLKDFEAANKGGLLSPVSVTVAGQQLNLVEVYELASADTIATQVTMPRQPQAKVTQWTDTMSYQDTGCSGQGYNVAHSPQDLALSTQVLLLPLSDRFLTEAKRTLGGSSANDSLAIDIPAEGTIQIGVYAVGPLMNNWMAHGALPPELTTQTVNSSCYTVCTQSECVGSSGGGHDFVPESLPETSPSAGGCTCTNQETRRNTTSLTYGTDRHAPKLSWPAEQMQVQARFDDVDATQDAETREIPVFSDQMALEWLD